MTSHGKAWELARQALVIRFEREPFHGEIVHLAGVSCLETSHGEGWKGAGKGSHNQGAIQCGSGWKGERFSYTDTHPNADGSSTPYRIDFRKYATELDGWVDLVQVAFVNRGRAKVREAAALGNTLGVSQALHDTGYYEGFGPTVASRIQNHFRSLSRAIARDTDAHTPRVIVSTMPSTVQFGDRGADVAQLQRELQIAADGIFGKITKRELIEYHTLHGLVPDAICGPKTWAMLFGDDYVPEAT